MFTVKIIDHQFQEELIEARSVSLVIPENAKTDNEKELRIAHDGGVTIVSSGQVYVMNANGKTVADYLFSLSPNPNAFPTYRK